MPATATKPKSPSRLTRVRDEADELGKDWEAIVFDKETDDRGNVYWSTDDISLGEAIGISDRQARGQEFERVQAVKRLQVEAGTADEYKAAVERKAATWQLANEKVPELQKQILELQQQLDQLDADAAAADESVKRHDEAREGLRRNAPLWIQRRVEYQKATVNASTRELSELTDRLSLFGRIIETPHNSKPWRNHGVGWVRAFGNEAWIDTRHNKQFNESSHTVSRENYDLFIEHIKDRQEQLAKVVEQQTADKAAAMAEADEQLSYYVDQL